MDRRIVQLARKYGVPLAVISSLFAAGGYWYLNSGKNSPVEPTPEPATAPLPDILRDRNSVTIFDASGT